MPFKNNTEKIGNSISTHGKFGDMRSLQQPHLASSLFFLQFNTHTHTHLQNWRREKYTIRWSHNNNLSFETHYRKKGRQSLHFLFIQ